MAYDNHTGFCGLSFVQLGADIETGYIVSDATIKEIGDHVIEIGDKEAKATITLSVVKAEE
ncbi:MAG: hypothetical protein HGA67_00505 [Candidatus Yonathbacteria bacterium]|nr:hypothetical protein [Candidatus Yonathbacteria bacterium]